jgi:hypothetical protein
MTELNECFVIELDIEEVNDEPPDRGGIMVGRDYA